MEKQYLSTVHVLLELRTIRYKNRINIIRGQKRQSRGAMQQRRRRQNLCSIRQGMPRGDKKSISSVELKNKKTAGNHFIFIRYFR